VVEKGQAMTTTIKPVESVPGVVRLLLRVAAGLALLYYAWMIFDLVTHPFSHGNSPGMPYLFRWLSALTGTFTVLVAVFIMRRVPRSIIGLLLLFWGVGATIWSLRADYGSPNVTGLVQVGYEVYFIFIAFPALDALIFHFPTGEAFPRRLSGWIWRLLLFSGLFGLLPVLAPSLSSYLTVATTIITVLVPSLALVSLGLRYRAAGTTERAQIKWLVWFAGLALVISIGMGVFFPASTNGEAALIAKAAGYLFWQAFPAIAIGIALLRYRLWDIDLIIRRSLVYGVLSGTLALIYFGGVTFLQWFFTAITGQQSPASIVISTLLIAALFSPLRRRVQGFIDRRFYRRKYDADQAIESFSVTARDQVEYDHLTRQFVNVVEETIRPETISLWLKKDR
jgi:hypothetical protein